MSNVDAGTKPASARGPRAIFFGLGCRMSLIPLATLIERGVEIRAVVNSAPQVHGRPLSPISPVISRTSRAFLPLMVPGTEKIDQVAARHGIPVLQVGSLRHPATLDALRALEPDLIAVSCFPRRLPVSLLEIAPLGAINLHPSLLPAYRGPDPLFWIFRDGERRAGVTVHLMTAEFDAGDILGQQALDLPDGTGGDLLEARCAQIGGRLQADAAWALWKGSAERRPQDERKATYRPRPGPDDLLVDPGWSARRAFNFIRGVIPLGYTPLIETETERLAVTGAISFDEQAMLDASSHETDRALLVRSNPGVLSVTVAGD